ncbi:hypothetical protein ACJ41O_014024 [Fusarium nematophilum]
MTDVCDPSRVSGALMLAAATGESGELLRLARVDRSRWQWGHDEDTILNLSVIDPDDPDEEAIWASDGLPISQVKFATSLSRYDAARWLIVQKQTSTTILQPEYHKVPVAQTVDPEFCVHRPRPSRIDPNPVLTLSHKQTGGNAQVDAAFNPNSRGQPPQLAIMDECGYWSVWDVPGSKRHNSRLSLQKCGHISEGLLNELPSITGFPAEKHGISFVGTAATDSFWEDPSSQDVDEASRFASPSSHILLWNREKYEVLDLVSNIALPRLSILSPSKRNPDSIIDIRVSPVNQNHIIVLTMRNLFWIDLFAPNEEEETPSKPDIASPGDIQSLEIHPASLTANGVSTVSPGSAYLEAGVHFYQGSILSKDLGVRYCIFASAKDRDMEITLPTTRAGRAKADPAHRWRRKRRQFLRHIGNTFVLPDGMSEADMNGLMRPPLESKYAMNADGLRASAVFGPIHLKFDILCQAIRQNLLAVATGSHDIPPGLVLAIQDTIAEGVAEGKLRLKTWKEIGNELGPFEPGTGDDGAQPDVLDLFLGDDSHTVVTRLGRQASQEWVRSLFSLSHLSQTYRDLWLDPLEGRLSEEDEETRRGWVADLAKDMFLATAGVMVQDTPLLGPPSQGDNEERQQSQPSSVRIKSSQSSDPVIPSSPVSTASNAADDAAIRRLQLLAPSIRLDKMASAKQSSVLSYWPTERGVGTENYISSVAEASDRKFDDARQRLQKIENKRKAQAEKYKLPPFMRQGGESRRATQGSSQVRPQRDEAMELPDLPPPSAQVLSSQPRFPESSQSQGVLGPLFPMSQPVAGAFGDRKKAKKGKRKSGFR